MKKPFILLVFLSLASSVFSQNRDLKNSIELNIDPLGYIFLKPNIGLDYNFNQEWSIEGTAGYRLFPNINSNDNDFETNRIELNLIPKYYFENNSDSRIYASLFARYAHRTATYSRDSINNEFSRTKFGLGIMLGAKIETKSNVVFDANVGIGQSIINQAKYSDEDEDYVLNELNLNTLFGLLVTAKLSIGYRFGGKKAVQLPTE